MMRSTHLRKEGPNFLAYTRAVQFWKRYPAPPRPNSLEEVKAVEDIPVKTVD